MEQNETPDPPRVCLFGAIAVMLRPNPFTNNFTLSFSAVRSATATLRIQNSAGHLVLSKQIAVTKGTNSVVMNSLPAMATGVYYITVNNDELNLNSKLQKF